LEEGYWPRICGTLLREVRAEQGRLRRQSIVSSQYLDDYEYLPFGIKRVSTGTPWVAAFNLTMRARNV
jgi:hypothetical protein